ncbi:HNH endonuclease [Pseudomonas aeruginosa]|uniref:HNH endonuclease n=1 Tax=Pseudomonas aeruginosa TaxID=287 RepID=UPI003B51BE5B
MAWLYCYGKWPAAQVDHLNHRRDDNRLSNLREASHSRTNGMQVFAGETPLESLGLASKPVARNGAF